MAMTTEHQGSTKNGQPQEPGLKGESSWRAVEAEALAQVRAEMEQAAPLELGATVAWSTYRFGRTDGFSVVHRVGELVGDQAMTLCGDLVPEPIARLTLTPRLIRSMGTCQYCESAQALRVFAA